MINASYREFDALTRSNLAVFVQRVFAELNPGVAYLDNFHIHVIVAALEDLRVGGQRRLAVAMPPRSLKSIIISVAYPAWLLGHDPTAKIIAVSYGQDLADKMAHDCRQVMQSRWYRRLFPRTVLAPKRQSLSAFETTLGGGRFSTSVGGVITGFGADHIIVDDPMKPEDALSDADRRRTNDWIQHTLFTRLNDKRNGRIVIVMQRLHEDDVIGNIMEKAAVSSFRLLSFAAIAQEDEEHIIPTPFGRRLHRRAAGEALHPEREPLDVLEEQRRLLGSQHFAGQYLQMPAPPGGNMIKREWLQIYDSAHPPKFDYVIQSWDIACRDSPSSDYSVCITFGVRGGHVYVLDVFRKRLEYPDLKRSVRAQWERFRPREVLIEDTASGIALIQELRAENVPGLRACKPIKSKTVRMDIHTAELEAGSMFVPAVAPWVDSYVHELTMFPQAKYDDQVDATSQALALIFIRTGLDGILNGLARRKGREADQEVASVRVNHNDPYRQFILNSSREIRIREADGSFLVTPNEAEGLIFVEGIILPPQAQWRVESWSSGSASRHW